MKYLFLLKALQKYFFPAIRWASKLELNIFAYYFKLT